jgi:heptosyltransferase-3
MSALINALSAAGYPVVLTSGPDAKEKQMIDTIMAGCPMLACTPRRAANAAPAGVRHRPRPPVYRRRLRADAYGRRAGHAAGGAVRPSKLTFWRPWQAKGEVIWAGDFGPLPDPDDIDTNTDERYLDLIPTDAVIAAAKKVLA